MTITTAPIPALSGVQLTYKPNVYPVPNSDSLPRMYFVSLFVGSRGSGKTHSCCQLLKLYETHGISTVVKGKKRDIAQRIILMSPTATANPVFTSLKHLDPDDVIDSYTDDKLTDVIADIRAEKEATDAYRKALVLWKKFRKCASIDELDYDDIITLALTNFTAPEPPRFPNGCVTFLVLDDLVGSSAFKATGKSALTALCLKNRHLAVSICICTQNLKAIPKSIRSNTSLFVIFRFASAKVIAEDLYEEVSSTLTIDEFMELYQYATEGEHDALIMDFSQPKERRFKMNWGTALGFAQ